MKFLKVDNDFINMEHVKMFGVNIMSEGDEENKYYFDICVNDGPKAMNLSVPLIGFSDDTQMDLFTKNLFRFTNYKNAPGVFDVQKNVYDILAATTYASDDRVRTYCANDIVQTSALTEAIITETKEDE